LKYRTRMRTDCESGHPSTRKMGQQGVPRIKFIKCIKYKLGPYCESIQLLTSLDCHYIITCNIARYKKRLTIYRVGQIKRGHSAFLLVTNECIYQNL